MTDAPCHHALHTALVLKRCGHEEGCHFNEENASGEVEPHCHLCHVTVLGVDEKPTDECYHAYEPPPTEETP